MVSEINVTFVMNDIHSYTRLLILLECLLLNVYHERNVQQLYNVRLFLRNFPRRIPCLRGCLYQLACSLHHVAFQLIALLRRLSDVLQVLVSLRHTSSKETDVSLVNFPATDPSRNYSSCQRLMRSHIIVTSGH